MSSILRSLHPLLLVVLVVGCKTDKPAGKPAAPPPAPKREPVSGPRPALPVPAPEHPHPGDDAAAAAGPLDVKRVEQLSPTLPNAKRMTALSVQAKFGQARESWCTTTPDPAEAAKQIAAMLSRDGWSDVTSRSSGDRAAISAIQDGVHIAVTLGGTDAACKGGLATHVIYHGATTTAPPLEPGEQVH